MYFKKIISDNPLICNCDILWLKEWLSNDHNRDQLKEAGEEHRCETPHGGKHHVLVHMTDSDFKCKPHHSIKEDRVSNFFKIIITHN